MKSFLSDSQILQDQKKLSHYGRDWVPFYKPNPSLAVFPKTTEEAAQLVQWARRNKTALVPSGGRTGLSGGAVAIQKEVIVSFEKMNQLIEFNKFEGVMTMQAGMITQEVQRIAEEHGYFMPISFSAEGSSHIGGNTATNVGGIHVIHYGHIRRWIVGLKAVTGTGGILDLGRCLIKDNAGYSLKNLLIGSEGTLGLITEVSLALTKKPGNLHVFLMACSNMQDLIEIYSYFKRETSLHAFEMFTQCALDYVEKSGVRKSPLAEKSPYYILMEVLDEDQEKTLEIFEKLMNEGKIQDGAMSQNSQQAQEIWALRENISESLSPYKPYKNDISVRTSKLSEFLVQMDQLMKEKYPHYTVVWFGHIGDGNLHINIIKNSQTSEGAFLEDCKTVNQLLFSKVQEFGGSISAEHGVGLVKKEDLHYCRSKEEIKYMKAIKNIFDPHGILNPGKIIDC